MSLLFVLLFSKVGQSGRPKIFGQRDQKKNDRDPKCIFLCLRSFDTQEGEKENFF
jgi:hypothetical protein